MTDDKLTREERLAAKLRENLRRRKAQARSLTGESVPADVDAAIDADIDSPALPKPPLES
jgi:hypothetical protein